VADPAFAILKLKDGLKQFNLEKSVERDKDA